jgi:hypothetical protein
MLLVLGALPAPAVAEPPDEPFFSRIWERTDYPVAESVVARTWMWGPEAFTPPGQEQYAESPGGWRTVQYFDKSRMEITDPAGDGSSPWFVTNGLLVVEMIRGIVQAGDATFFDYPAGPAHVNVAGDADDATGPTYATFAGHLLDPALAPGTLIARRINRVGTVTYDAGLEDYDVSAGFLDVITDHTIAAPFWDFMNSTGLIYEDGGYANDELFLDPFYATGRPITEAYWANVKVADSYQDVLMQCFERRCLTYTPGNAPEWQVEAGNVGRHYYAWRYGDFEDAPPNTGLLLYRASFEDWTEWPAGVVMDGDDRYLGDPLGWPRRCDGDFCISIPAETNTWSGARGDLPGYADVGVVAPVTLVQSVPGDRACLVSRFVETEELLQLYAYCLTGSADLIAFYYEETAAGPTSTWLIPPGTVHADGPLTDWHHLAMISRGHDFWFIANSELIGEATHTAGPLEGDVALAAQRLAAGEETLVAVFGDLFVIAVD